MDFSLFGTKLIRPSTGDTGDPEEILAGKVVLLYFGAHWCPPCNKFTPKLHFFNQLQAENDTEDFEIVFCSMDRSEQEYSEYSDQMPWWCLPYALSTLPRLAAHYHAQNLPHLVVIDGDGEIVTKEGVSCLTQDPLGKSFPWRPKRVVELLPDEYLDSDGVTRHAMSLLDDKYLLLYFAQNSCELCESFTPWLVKAYNILKKRRPDDFELLFVSGDADPTGFGRSFREMTCCAIPYEGREATKMLEARLEIQGYPTLLMLGPKPDNVDNNFGDRPVINAEVRAVIENGDYISDFPYYPKPYGDLCRTTDDINKHKCLIVFYEGGDPEEQDDVEETVKQAATEYRGDELIKFYWATDPEAPLARNIRLACRLGQPREEPSMVLLDIPDDGAFYVSEEIDITVATIMYFLVNKAERRQI